MDYVLTVYPTAVLLSEDDLITAMNMLTQDSKADTVMTAAKFAFPIQRAIRKNQHGYAESIQPEHYQKRSQDLPEAMHDAGQFYLSKADAVRQCARLDNSTVKIHALHRSRFVDIDTFEDFHLAEERLNIHKAQKTIRLEFFRMSEIVPVILCGGVGSRLWPLSRKSLPKQFAPLVGAAVRSSGDTC